MNKITATTGNVFRRINDGLIFGKEIYLGVDYSTGTARPDKTEYYEEIEAPVEELTQDELLLQEHNAVTELINTGGLLER